MRLIKVPMLLRSRFSRAQTSIHGCGFHIRIEIQMTPTLRV